ncbi:hypothetical protein PVAND_015881 [Polypedilum vanderplanki]|uniref:Uncharacterized protein n=1 Tax=Polypedilum vanderplanki TaxID=319348 RepID=A0A9J6BDI3_POLVA|nr:hypothetical protein PVAND_015881 [Polypedilum vanderplanki]
MILFFSLDRELENNRIKLKSFGKIKKERNSVMKRIFVSSFLLIFFTISLTSSLNITIQCKTSKGSNSCVNHVIKIEEKGAKIVEPINGEYTELHLRSTIIHFLPINLKEAFPKIQTLKVFNSSLKEVKKENFEGFLNLTNLELNKNILEKLQSDTFESLIKLEKIVLSGNKIKYLHGSIFSKNLNLTEIVISNNQLETLNDQTFKKLTKLKILDLSFNFIEDFNSGTFKDCKELKRFDFSHNNLKHSPDDIFKGLEKLKIDKKHIRNNKCIEDYENYHETKVTDKNELINAFKESCKPSNQEKLDEMNRKIEELTKENEELKKNLKTCNKDLDDKKKEVQDLGEAKKECDDDLATKTEEAEKFDEIKTNLEITNEAQEKEIKELKEFHKNSNNSNQILNEELKNLKISYVNLEKNFEAVKNTNFIFGNDLKNMTEKHKNTKEKAEKCKENFRTLQEISQNLNFEKNYLEENLKICKENVTSCDLMTKYYFQKIYEKGKDCEFNAQNQNLPEIIQNSARNSEILFDFPCNFGKLENKIFLNVYSCSILNFANLNCNSKLNKISGVHSSLLNSDRSVEGLNIQDTSIVASTLNVFENFNNLKVLSIQGSNFGNFEYKCGKIETIYVVKSTIGEELEISKCSSLKKLIIDSTNLKVIKSSQVISTLTEIYLKNNKIENISQNFFKNFDNLISIDLSKNKISQLDGRMFDYNTNLKNAIFTDNPIIKINGDIFNRNRNLQVVVFKNCRCIDKNATGASKINELKAEIKEKCK